MAQLFRVDDVALTLLQVISLLFPVILFTMRYVAEHEVGHLSDNSIRNFGVISMIMIGLLTIIGLFSSLSIIYTPLRDSLIQISVIALALFFLCYGIAIYVLVRSE